MNERMSRDEITERYPDEWVVLVDIDEDPSEADIRAATVFSYSRDRDEAEAAASKLPTPRDFGVFFTGPLTEPGIVPTLTPFFLEDP